MNYKHITINERCCIANFLDLGWSIRKIAKHLNRNASTISREVRRNSINGKYLAHIANEIYLNNRMNCGSKGKSLKSKETRGKFNIGKSIKNRLKDIRKRESFGHWELDTVVSSRGKSKACLSTFVERKSRYLIAQVMDDRKSATFNSHCFEAFKFISNTLIKTFTVDRGKEFAGYNEIEKRLNIDVYFADPYASWQRGTNENTNGLVREFYPKRFDFSTITQNELDVVVNIINNRPRKCLGYKTPAEVFAAT